MECLRNCTQSPNTNDQHYPEELTIEGFDVPCYITHFTKDGELENIHRYNRMIEIIRNGQFTDVYIFSHGWNTDEEGARTLYSTWIAGYLKLRKDQMISSTKERPYKPVFIGIVWPSKWKLFDKDFWHDSGNSTSLKRKRVMENADDDDGAEHARGNFKSIDVEDLLAELADDNDITDENRKCLMSICSQTTMLSSDQTNRLLELLSPLFADDEEINTPVMNKSTVTTARQEGLRPADIVRLLSFWQMRKRAGVVGSNGVHTLVHDILTLPSHVRLHLIGHSFGAKVVLTAVTGKKGTKWLPNQKVTSILLLQPAIVNRVFDASPSRNTGQYREVLNRVELPIITTFSDKDFPLRVVFHVAVQLSRIGNLGRPQPEFRISNEKPPDTFYSALGGYPPTALSDKEFRIFDPVNIGEPYEFGKQKVCAVRMNEKILDHVEISNDDTYYLLHTLVER